MECKAKFVCDLPKESLDLCERIILQNTAPVVTEMKVLSHKPEGVLGHGVLHKRHSHSSIPMVSPHDFW